MSSPTSDAGTPQAALVVNVRGAARICVPPDLGQTTTYVLLEQEDWFEDEIRFVRRWLRPGMRAVDVGASYGLYTLAAARAVGPSGRVWAYEPTPQTADHLARTLELNGCGQVQLLRTALSDHAGTVAFSVHALSEQNAVADTAGAPAGAIVVPAATLDGEASAQRWQSIDFVKLDVEGHEVAAVRGGAAFFARESPLVMLEVKLQETFALEPLALLAELGYAFYRLLPGLLILVPFDPGEALDSYQLNLFACKPDRAARLAAEGLLDDGVEVECEGNWGTHVRAAPYAQAHAHRWSARPGFFASAADKDYRQGLAAYAGSRDPGASPGARCSALRRATALVLQAAEHAPGLARQLSLARLAWETGRRGTAVAVLMEALPRLDEEAEEAWREPFLAPAVRYEAIVPGGRDAEWLRCAATEQFERVRSYSSAFSQDTSLELLAPVRELPFCSPEMERRWQLVRIATGRQAVPQCTARLRKPSDENLNADFWCANTPN
jgi:FkbM family methyltransferase